MYRTKAITEVDEIKSRYFWNKSSRVICLKYSLEFLIKKFRCNCETKTSYKTVICTPDSRVRLYNSLFNFWGDRCPDEGTHRHFFCKECGLTKYKDYLYYEIDCCPIKISTEIEVSKKEIKGIKIDG